MLCSPFAQVRSKIFLTTTRTSVALTGHNCRANIPQQKFLIEMEIFKTVKWIQLAQGQCKNAVLISVSKLLSWLNDFNPKVTELES